MFTTAYAKSMAERSFKTFIQVIAALAGADALGWVNSAGFVTDLKVALIAALMSVITTTYAKIRGKDVPAAVSVQEAIKQAADLLDSIEAEAKKRATPKAKAATKPKA